MSYDTLAIFTIFYYVGQLNCNNNVFYKHMKFRKQIWLECA